MIGNLAAGTAVVAALERDNMCVPEIRGLLAARLLCRTRPAMPAAG
jgi:hypothetical protein